MKKVKNFLVSRVRQLLAHPTVVKLLHTFWQSFLAVWLVNGFKLDKVVFTAALAAGFSAAKSVLLNKAQRS